MCGGFAWDWAKMKLFGTCLLLFDMFGNCLAMFETFLLGIYIYILYVAISDQDSLFSKRRGIKGGLIRHV